MDPTLLEVSRDYFRTISENKYGYDFTWLGRPIIQIPQDIMAMQEIIWNIKPDLIIETGIAHGGSLIFSASMLELIGEEGIVIGIDIDIRPHNREAIEKHPMYKRIVLLEGDSTSQEIVDKVIQMAQGCRRILVSLDSNHTHQHVLRELELYSPLVTLGSYCVVFDTAIEDLPKGSFPDRPWDKGNNPKTAVWEFLKENTKFQIDKKIEEKILLTVAPDGYLKRIN
ncbi:cephalosporin hydroxylase family protein [Methanospirillum lacunae]|uniref:Cephalosporin hydroxylase n=1 Tax=Methanospirillum lacunae TaxID=668570 RepID=A0A2V2N3D5_9EURY|nr:cephalosporin hydroxylase family protein [Methanospirillum lacunae]PWR70697.1 cephalosporin hydroxylase [Methanospirillum lacunae]